MCFYFFIQIYERQQVVFFPANVNHTFSLFCFTGETSLHPPVLCTKSPASGAASIPPPPSCQSASSSPGQPRLTDLVILPRTASPSPPPFQILPPSPRPHRSTSPTKRRKTTMRITAAAAATEAVLFPAVRAPAKLFWRAAAPTRHRRPSRLPNRS